jgi:excisionase family DNA binding protein
MIDYNVLTVEEVARALRISEDSVRAMIKRKTLPAIKVGKSYRIKQSDLDALMQTEPPKQQQ